MQECECKRARQHEYRLKKAGLPERYWGVSFDNFETTGLNRSVAHALMMSQAFVKDYATQGGTGLLFTGTVGTGKTHLAIAILRAVSLQYGASTRFVDFRELLKRMQATFGSNKTITEEEVLRPILDAELVALDELGAARVTDWTFDVVEHVINTRYNANKRTILTTNLPNKPAGWTPQRNASGGSYAERLGAITAVETLGDRIGARMFSRVQQMCVALEVNGDDYRSRGRG